MPCTEESAHTAPRAHIYTHKFQYYKSGNKRNQVFRFLTLNLAQLSNACELQRNIHIPFLFFFIIIVLRFHSLHRKCAATAEKIINIGNRQNAENGAEQPKTIPKFIECNFDCIFKTTAQFGEKEWHESVRDGKRTNDGGTENCTKKYKNIELNRDDGNNTGAFDR